MGEEVRVNSEMYCGNQEDYDALKMAVKQLSSVSQEQFETIKKEKWYNRVFDMVTFSQKGRKRIAEQVSTLAQAQQILIELLMRLSDNDSSVSKLVMESMEDIKKIQEQNLYLLSKIKKLEDISLGIKPDMDLNKLSEENKKVLCACLYNINAQDGNASENQKTFANQVMNYLNVDAQMEQPTAALEDMDTESKKRILNCCMEYMFLKNCSGDGYEAYEDFIYEFDFGNKTIKAIEKQIQSFYNLRGLDGFFTKYQADNFEAPDDFFTMDFEDGDDENIVSAEENIEMVDEVISTILQIKPGETKNYKNKNIHLKAYINCEGDLIFDHCIINYNEADNGNEIKLSNKANLTITNSIILCKEFDKNAFITCEGAGQVTLDRNTFEDCSHFIKSGSICEFSMTNCKLHNCFEDFIDLDIGHDPSTCAIKNNVMIQDGLNPFYAKVEKYWMMQLISVNSFENNTVEFYNNSIIEEEGFRKADVKKGKSENHIIYFDTAYGIGDVKNCFFKGISRSISAVKFIDCRFENCTDAINLKQNYSDSDVPCVDNCVFVDCTNVINTVDNAKISNCQFVSCYDQIIDPSEFDGGVSVEFCQFINTRNAIESYSSNLSCVQFQRGRSSDAKANYLKNCIFDGADLEDNFLIGAVAIEKPSGTVTHIENCDFKNCSTQRESGKIIKEYVQYDTLFKKDVNFHANTVSGCKGLDKINKEGSKSDSAEIRPALNIGVSGDVGAPAALLQYTANN